MWKIAIPVSTAGLALSAALALSSPADHVTITAADVCGQTTRAAYRACLNDVDDAAGVALGNCLNLTDPKAREDCLAERDEARDEGRAECAEQQDARDDVCDQLGPGAYDPVIDPANFLSPEETAMHPNPYFPLVPNTHWVYQHGTETTDVRVTGDTKVILGVTCTTVHDVVSDQGVPVEDTDDWYAQDLNGNVWYFGELSVSYEDGVIAGIDGSWTGGVEYAKPGIIMKAAPHVGDVYRQEYSIANAEDMGAIASITGTEHTPAASCTGDCVVTNDFTAIEPGVIERKYYAPGVGFILEIVEDGSREELVLYEPGSMAAAHAAGALRGLHIDDRSTVTPLRTDTGISFSLAATTPVTAHIFDAAGRDLRTIDGGTRTAGDHTLAWDGLDAGGRRVAPGIYFVRVDAGRESGTRRIVITR